MWLCYVRKTPQALVPTTSTAPTGHSAPTGPTRATAGLLLLLRLPWGRPAVEISVTSVPGRRTAATSSRRFRRPQRHSPARSGSALPCGCRMADRTATPASTFGIAAARSSCSSSETDRPGARWATPTTAGRCRHDAETHGRRQHARVHGERVERIATYDDTYVGGAPGIMAHWASQAGNWSG